MKEYKLAKGWAIFIWIFAPLLIILFLLGLLTPVLPATKDDVSLVLYLALIMPLSLGMIILILIGLLDAVKSIVIISGDLIIFKSTFRNHDLKSDEIKGFRVSDKYIFVEPNTESKKRIKISTYFGKIDEVTLWLSSNFPDLDLADLKKEQIEILQNDRYGTTEEERGAKLQKARLVAKVINWLSIAVIVWILFFPIPYELVIIFAITIPFIAILVIYSFKGLIRIDEGKGSTYPSVFIAIFFSACGICLRAILDFNIFDYSNVWKLSILLLAVLMVLIFLASREFKFQKAKHYIVILAISVFLFAYSYGTVVILNCYYDKSDKELFQASILSKRISSGKTTSYYFELTPWGSRTQTDEVSVSKQLYNKLERGDKVNLFYSKGLFDIPWFIVTE